MSEKEISFPQEMPEGGPSKFYAEELPVWVEEVREMYEEIKAMSKSQRRKKYGTAFAEEFADTERIDELRRDPSWEYASKWTEKKFWEWVRGVLHDYGVRDLYQKGSFKRSE